jgi:hypothetical protein
MDLSSKEFAAASDDRQIIDGPAKIVQRSQEHTHDYFSR